MSKYYFHVRDGAELNRDPEGQELPNLESARREALNTAREMISERLLHGGSLNHKQIEIADETGHVVDVINSRDVLLKNGQFRSYPDDITQSTPTKSPRK